VTSALYSALYFALYFALSFAVAFLVRRAVRIRARRARFERMTQLELDEELREKGYPPLRSMGYPPPTEREVCGPPRRALRDHAIPRGLGRRRNGRRTA